MPRHFLLSCRKVISFALARYTIGLRKLAAVVNPKMKVKPKLIVTRRHTCFCVLRQLHEIASSFHRFIVLCMSFVIFLL